MDPVVEHHWGVLVEWDACGFVVFWSPDWTGIGAVVEEVDGCCDHVVVTSWESDFEDTSGCLVL